MKLITFTVPCYNSAEYMHKCVESLLIAGDEAEIIIIDDGSVDKTGVIADEYAAKYPDIIKVVHQENGGHGEGINQGIKNATGYYFKVVDSDDTLDEDGLKKTLARLRELNEQGGVDLFICNYAYVQANSDYRKVIDYKMTLPEDKICSWNDLKRFDVTHYFTLHSSIFRTAVLHESGYVLPKHTFYEDNIYIYAQLPYVKRLYYLNTDLYLYLVGREGQSVSEEASVRRYAQQLKVAELMFTAYHLPEIKKKNKKMEKYMYHTMMFIVAVAVVFARKNGSKESEQVEKDFWERLEAFDKKTYHRVKYRSLATVVSNGSVGRPLSRFFYRLAHIVVRFN